MPTAWWGVRPDLAVGCYDVKVTFQDSNDKPSRWLMGLEIREDETREETVEFSSGTVVVNAQMQDGDALANFQASIKPWQRTTLVRAWVNAILTGSLRACSPQYK